MTTKEPTMQPAALCAGYTGQMSKEKGLRRPRPLPSLRDPVQTPKKV